MKRAVLRLFLLCSSLFLLSIAGCRTGQGNKAKDALAALRESAAESRDSELVARWLLGELISPGGDARRATAARQRLLSLGGKGMLANLALGIDDSLHGRLTSAPDHFLGAAQAARSSRDPNAELVAWFSIHSALETKDYSPALWTRWKPFVVEAIRSPLRLGWRARSELVDWWSEEQYAQATKDVEERSFREFGCVEHLRLAGPFGRAAAVDAFRKFPAEAPAPWPRYWQKLPGRGEAPRLLDTERHGCMVSAAEATAGGIYYAEAFLDVPEDRELVLAVQGALAIWVDDQRVLNRDPRIWGVWPKFGVQLWLERGRHRVLAKLASPSASLRVLFPDGRPSDVRATVDFSEPYSLARPRLSGDPNAIDRFIRPSGVVDPGDDTLRFMAAYLAALEGQADVASLLHEPLVADAKLATGPALAAAANYVEKDPLFDASQVKDLSRELHERAAKKDPKLWKSRLALALWQGQKSSPAEGAAGVKALATEFGEVPAIMIALVRVYGELGWNAEYARSILDLERRFPDDVEVLHLALEVHDSRGAHAHADALVERIKKLDPDDEVVLNRALARQDYAAALAELERIAKRRPERKEIAERIYDVMVRAGNTSETWKKLQAAIEQEPRDPRPRLALADARYASGQRDALRKALVDAVESGAPTEPLKDAIELVEGKSELEPYRLDGKGIILDWEASKRELPGTAARVLDYAAIWVHADGSSRMLEHQVVRIQSAEAISRFAEHPRNQGIVLHLRVIKKNGQVLEPEEVAGKPTVTFPHLEVGDYIETEHIVTRPGDGQQGSRYEGPHWFFREPNVAYARSELVVISPENKPLVIETRGQVPPPSVQQLPGVVVRRWRVDSSPAAPVEPASAPPSEFLPSVVVGWGVTLDDRLQALADNVAEVIPVDPRIARIAGKIVGDAKPARSLEWARRLYRWVLDNVEHGEETDGRRAIVGKNGNRWRAFMTLARAVGLDVRYAVAKNRLASPPVGVLSASSSFNEPLLYVKLESNRGAWVTFEAPVDGNPESARHLPFGYVPADVRGMPAYLLGENERKLVTIPAGGTPDGIAFAGKVKLAGDGSAKIDLSQSFLGKYAMQLRTGLSQVPTAQLRDLIESRLLGQSLRGARLLDYKIDNRDNLDQPLILRMSASMPGFAQVDGRALTIVPPFAPRISAIARLPERQTPLLLGAATHQKLELAIELPPGSTLETPLVPAKIVDQDRVVTLADRTAAGGLVLVRDIDMPTGRVQPRDYAAFVAFARRADDALARSIRVRLGR